MIFNLTSWTTASLVAQQYRIHLPMQETLVWSLGGEHPLEKEMATHSSIFVWKIPWTEEPGGLQSTGLQRVRHILSTKQQQQPDKRGSEHVSLFYPIRRLTWYHMCSGAPVSLGDCFLDSPPISIERWIDSVDSTDRLVSSTSPGPEVV